MTSYALVAAQISTIIVWVGFMFITHAMSRKESVYPPKVSSLLPWIGSAIGFVSGPQRFLALCRRVGHQDNFRTFCGDTSLYPMIYDALSHMFSILDRRLSRRAVDGVTAGFAETVFQRLKLYSGGDRVSLKRSLVEPLYCAATAVFLGTSPIPLLRRPFWSLPSTQARARVLQHITTCLRGADPDNDNDKLASNFAEVIREKKIPLEVASPAVFALVLALHANQSNVIFWLFSWLMAHPRAFSSLRDDIDRAVREEFGSIETFIAEANPQRLDSPAFALLNSAILEAARLTTVRIALRRAECDLQLKDGEGTIPIRKGEYVLLYPRAAQQNEASYPGGHNFVLDRFVQSQYEGELSPTSGIPFFAFGAGKHLCKGRFIAIFGMKVLTILYLSLFDVTPVPLKRRSSEWEPPHSSARSVGTTHSDDDIYVRLRPRTAL
ncbi:cytochrome P450 [Pisolithus thermaeus]|nr:cytochrome P450 [Pisolithus thermaeus]